MAANSNNIMGFGEIISNQNVLAYLKSKGFQRPTGVQSECISPLLLKKDVAIQGKTGSGKTLGYLLPLIEQLKELEKSAGNSRDGIIGAPKALIVLPTRELALQVFGVLKEISHFAKLRIRKLVGGDKGKSLASLYASQIDVLVTTPDRCLRSFKNRELTLSQMKYLILDEVDQLLEPSFERTMGELIPLLNPSNLQVCLASASKPIGFDTVLENFFPRKKFLIVGEGEENIIGHKVKTFNIALEEEDKFSYITNFIENQKKANGLVFMGNKARAKRVYEVINQAGFEKILLLHKDLEIKDRNEVVNRFREKGGILIATDIFARGIDIPHLKWVLNFDLPSEPDYYLHRSGRVGRAGRTGDVFNFITSKDKHRKSKINESLAVQGRDDLRISGKGVL